MLINRKLIKTPDRNIDYYKFAKDIAPQIKQIYSPNETAAVRRFLGAQDIEFISEEKVFSDSFYLNRVKENFNSLKENGDVLFFGENYYLCAIPCKYIALFDIFGGLDKLIEESAYGKELEYIILYAITKDLKYLDLLSQTGKPVPLKVFDLCRENALEFYNEILKILKNGWIYKGRFHDAEASIKTRHDSKLHEIRSNIDEAGGKGKNLVIFHLESLSNEVYFNNRDKLQNLTKLLDSSMNFTRFYTSASSSVMSLFDLFYGNDFETDNYSNFKDLYHEKTYSTHLFQILKDNGYSTLGIGFNDSIEEEETNSSNVWNVEGQKYIWKEDFDEFLGEASEFIKVNGKATSPFAIHMWDLLTHSGHVNEETKGLHTYERKSALSFISLDIMIEKTISLLKSLDLLEDTIIICYGDHGDDLWSRSMNGGFTHVTVPYSNLVWTPACVYDSRIGSFLFNNLASMVDLKSTILYLMGIKLKESFAYQGINLIKQKNDFIYSRGLFYNQREYQRIHNYKMIALNKFSSIEENNKSLTVISDKYSLVVSSEGLELYLYLTDPFNRNNLLNFIEFDKNFVPRKLDNCGAWRGHFRKIMLRDSQVYEIVDNLNLLCGKLKERIKVKSEMITNTEVNPFNMKNFEKIRKRGFIE